MTSENLCNNHKMLVSGKTMEIVHIILVSDMKTVSVKMTWEGEAKEVAVGGEFNGWVPVPLSCQQV